MLSIIGRLITVTQMSVFANDIVFMKVAVANIAPIATGIACLKNKAASAAIKEAT